MTTAKDVMKMIKDNDVKYVDFRFTDPRGKLQHVTVVADLVDEDFFEEGFMFDGSSIAGWKSIDQSDMIVSYVPELPGGVPGLSSGVERELHHAFEHTKEVYVVWKPKKPPSPFITETATKVFGSVQDALGFFELSGMFGERNLFGH